MKKKSLLALTLVMTLLLSACGGGDKLVEIEIPKMIVSQSFGDITEESAQELVSEEEGIKEVELKEDGSLVLKLTKEGHEALVAEMDEQVKTIINELKDSDQIPFVKDITFTEDYKEVKIIADKENYETSPETGTVVAGMIGGAAGAYQSYAKVDVGVNIVIEDESGEELSSLNYPDDLKGVLGY